MQPRFRGTMEVNLRRGFVGLYCTDLEFLQTGFTKEHKRYKIGHWHTLQVLLYNKTANVYKATRTNTALASKWETFSTEETKILYTGSAATKARGHTHLCAGSFFVSFAWHLLGLMGKATVWLKAQLYLTLNTQVQPKTAAMKLRPPFLRASRIYLLPWAGEERMS